MNRQVRLVEGMVVHSSDGGKLGRIVSCLPNGFIVEKGLFLPKASQFRYEDVSDVRDGEVYLLQAREVLSDETWWKARTDQPQPQPQAQATPPKPVPPPVPVKAQAQAAPTPMPPRPAANLQNVQLFEEELAARKALHDRGEVRLHKRVVTTKKDITVPLLHEEISVERVPFPKPAPAAIKAATPESLEEIRVPLCEEELRAEKHAVPSGEIRIHKRVVTTKKQLVVPVMREEVVIERIAYDHTPAKSNEGMFVESTQVIPLHDESVEIHKYPVIREQVRITKKAMQEQHTESAEVRREELDIDQPQERPAPWTESREPREFTEGVQVIPLHEEEIEIRKVPVVREEVVLKKTSFLHNRTAVADTLREELDIVAPKEVIARQRGQA
jgi:uncharacterized protein (TIGR02271 family)